MIWRGSYVAIVTPFKDDQIDERALRKLVRFHVESGTAGIVPCGTTGESATLSMAEHERVIELVIEEVDKRVPVIAGTGSNNTREAVRLTRHARDAGADASLLISPYYNKPTQAGLYQHFRTVAESVDIPIILYNIASRTAVNIEAETIARLSHDCANIVGVKEASGSLDQMSRIKHLSREDFVLLSGDDGLTLPVLSIGGVGVISVVANIVPRLVAEMTEAFEESDIARAQALHYELLPLVKAMFVETNPAPVKTAMELMGLCSRDVRLPLCELSGENANSLKKLLKDRGLLS